MGGMKWVCATAEAVVSRHGLVRAKTLSEAGISHSWVKLLVRMRVLRRYPPGVYGRDLDYPPAICATVKWPNVVVTGLSALALHRLCSEPRVVSLALDAHGHIPRSTELPVLWSWFPALADHPDVLSVTSFGIAVRTVSPTRALFECLKKLEAYPMGLVHQALHESLRLGMFDRRELHLLFARERGGRDALGAFRMLWPKKGPLPVPRQALQDPDRRFLPRDYAAWSRDDPPPF